MKSNMYQFQMVNNYTGIEIKYYVIKINIILCLFRLLNETIWVSMVVCLFFILREGRLKEKNTWNWGWN